MTQRALFPARAVRRDLGLPGAVVWIDEGFLSPDEATRCFEALRRGLAWSQETIRIAGRDIPLPRLTCWSGDPGRDYTYSGIHHAPSPWTPALARLKARVEAAVGAPFNAALANRYRDGRDSVSWHADDEPALGRAPTIASVSLGATRRFVFKPKSGGPARHAVDLAAGSLLVMAGETQSRWLHQAPKTRRPVAERINITFRRIGG
jgi:alkylated DNA repair dioxygenase AlkB